MWSSLTEMLIAKGSSQNLVRLSTTRIVSHYMTSFLVLHHEKSKVLQWTLKAKTITIDDITLPVIASTICKKCQCIPHAKAKNSSAKESISTQHANKRATWMLGTINKQISSQLSKTNASILVPIVKEVTAATHQ